MSTGWKVVIVVACALLALAGMAFVAIPRVLNGGEAPKAAAEEYFGALQRGDTGAAYDMLCGRLRRAMTRERYHELVWPLNAADPIMRVKASFGFAMPTIREAPVAVELNTTTRGFAFAATMRKEGGDWRWCGVTGEGLGGSRLDPRQRQ